MNSLYFTVQLFALHSGFYHNFVKHPPVVTLEIARWTAALASFGAIWYAVTSFMLHWLSWMRIRQWTKHHIICGLGHWTVELIQQLVKKGHRVLVIEKDPSDELIPTCARLQIPVLFGDASNEAILRKARIQHASCLVPFSGDDGTNVEITLTAGKLLAASPPANGRLTCYTHVVDRDLMLALEEHVTLGRSERAIELHFFNSYENAARQAVTDAISHVKPEELDALETVHLILIGLSAMGENVALQSVRNCHFKSGRRFRLTIVESDQQVVDAFLARYPAVPELCDFTAVIGTGSESATRAAIAGAVEDPRQLVFLAICYDGDQRSLDAVLRLPREIGVRRVPVYLRLSSPVGLAKVVEGMTAPGIGLCGEIRPFGLPEQCAGPDAIMRPQLEMVAKAIHDDYRIERLRQVLQTKGLPLPAKDAGSGVNRKALEASISTHFDLNTELAMLPWERLREGLRNSNRLQADHIPFKLLSAGWYAATRPETPADSLVDLEKEGEDHKDEVEQLAEIEHRRWIAERRLAGWIPGERNAALRQSPHLVPWQDLPDSIRDYDRQVIQALPRQLALGGLRLYRRAARSPLPPSGPTV